ncbi:hypothetical protein GH714_014741 [Hevea brasiliensis]|uniref:Uncharacterized protein n=1 Tax=Hevea brasiliensis TaxID=3981 RepID=A0A6A6L6L0_HEVBR|nr:hypothetical protein GH714_014741 [Hevea brasiliensis]
MASAAVDQVIGIIVSALQNEATLLVGINDELDEIRRELESRKSFLHDAARKQDMSEGVKTWVAAVRDTAHQIEDLIDEFTYYMYRQQCFTILHRIFRTPKTLCEKHRIASKLQQINKTIKGMDERRKRYGIDRIEGSSDHYLPLYQRDSALFTEEDDVVGFEEESWLLKTLLTDKEKDQTLISVVGMGGSGKTTLVAKAYKDETVKSCFDCYAWITVSQTYMRDDLLKSLIKEFHQSRKERVLDDLGTKGFKDLVEILIGYLKQKKYLVVLDDGWDINLWEAINVSLPNNELGSRIMLTTRKEDVGSYFSEDYKIQRKKLIRLWIAEGFVQQIDRTRPIEVAESYLMELILRSMLQVVQRNEFGRPKHCKMHDLLREIGLSISEREKFGVVYDGKAEIDKCKSHQVRRLSIQTTKGDLQSYSNMTRLRSLFVFVISSVSFSNTLLSKFKLLRALDLENAAIDILPEGLGTLFNLRYLNLRGTPVAKLPKSIGKLRNLEALDISETNIKELPSEVVEMQNLSSLAV